MPQNAAGRITEPAVWLPNAIGSIPAAIAAQEPDDQPPGVCARLCGLRVAAGTMVANSVVTVLPMTMPPGRRVRQFCLSRRLPRRDQVEHNEGADVFFARRNRLGAHVDDGAWHELAGFDAAGKIEG